MYSLNERTDHPAEFKPGVWPHVTIYTNLQEEPGKLSSWRLATLGLQASPHISWPTVSHKINGAHDAAGAAGDAGRKLG